MDMLFLARGGRNRRQSIMLAAGSTGVFFHLCLLLPLAATVSFNLPQFDRETRLTCSPTQKGLCLQGDAHLNQGLQLTKNHLRSSLTSSVGRAVFSHPIKIWDSATGQIADFSASFTFIIYDAEQRSTSGDGIAFFLSSHPSVIPENSAGGFLGLFPNSSSPGDGHDKVVAIEFDTYPNMEFDSIPADHIGIDVGSIISAVDFAVAGGIRKGTVAEGSVLYTAKGQTLSVTLAFRDSPLALHYNISHVVDLRQVLPEYVSVGFSAATGQFFETHTILSWSFSSNLNNTGHPIVASTVISWLFSIAAVLMPFLAWSWRKAVTKTPEDYLIKETRGEESDTGLGTGNAEQEPVNNEASGSNGGSLEEIGESNAQITREDSEPHTEQERQEENDINLGNEIEHAEEDGHGAAKKLEAISETSEVFESSCSLSPDADNTQHWGWRKTITRTPEDDLIKETRGKEADTGPGTSQTWNTKQVPTNDEATCSESVSLEEILERKAQITREDSKPRTEGERREENDNLDDETRNAEEDGHEARRLEDSGTNNMFERSFSATPDAQRETPAPECLLDVLSPKELPYHVLVSSTNSFSQEMILGRGGFGPVYRGFISQLALDVAVKKLSRSSEQGMSEYTAEVNIIAHLRHRNLVKLIGWCHEQGELMLVYEFLPNGSLDNHIFKESRLLDWSTRYKIALGLANALMYLHDECEPYVLHRDIKSSNVLLDSNFNPKLADFGLARLFDNDASRVSVSHPAGTRGYWAPEYALFCNASRKSDVYSYGVVVLEIACGRKAILAPGDDEVGGATLLVEWVWELYGKGAILNSADRRLNGNFHQLQMQRVLEVGLWCAHPDHRQRPSIRQASNALLYPEGTSPPSLPKKMPPWGFPLAPVEQNMRMQMPPITELSSTEISDDSVSTSSPPTGQTFGGSLLDALPEPTLHTKSKQSKLRVLPRFTSWLKKILPRGSDDSMFAFCGIGGLKELSYQELVEATGNFSTKIGLGGFGSVYKGKLNSGMDVAVKMYRRPETFSREYYISELRTHSRVAHRNVVKLIGWSHRGGLFFLVVEYMANGSLDHHLFGDVGQSTIPWKVRYKVALGLASALCYLHNDLEVFVIHRNVTTGNVLLDEDFNTKLGSFGLARETEHDSSAVSTKVVGTIGYLAPECAMLGRFSSATDVYSFGVVALEIACGRRAWITDSASDSGGYRSLVEVLWRHYDDGTLLGASDEKLMGNFKPEEMMRLMVVGLWCAHHNASQRPDMATALRALQFKEEPPVLPSPTALIPDTGRCTQQ